MRADTVCICARKVKSVVILAVRYNQPYSILGFLGEEHSEKNTVGMSISYIDMIAIGLLITFKKYINKTDKFYERLQIK